MLILLYAVNILVIIISSSSLCSLSGIHLFGALKRFVLSSSSSLLCFFFSSHWCVCVCVCA